MDFYIVSGICNRGFGPSGKRQSGFWFLGEFVIGLLTYRGYCNRAFGYSGNLLSGFWFVGDFVIGLLAYRGFVIGLMVIGLLAIGLMSYTRTPTHAYITLSSSTSPLIFRGWAFSDLESLTNRINSSLSSPLILGRLAPSSLASLTNRVPSTTDYQTLGFRHRYLCPMSTLCGGFGLAPLVRKKSAMHGHKKYRKTWFDPLHCESINGQTWSCPPPRCHPIFKSSAYPAVSKTRFAPCCTGLMSLRGWLSSCAYSLIGIVVATLVQMVQLHRSRSLK